MSPTSAFSPSPSIYEGGDEGSAKNTSQAQHGQQESDPKAGGPIFEPHRMSSGRYDDPPEQKVRGEYLRVNTVDGGLPPRVVRVGKDQECRARRFDRKQDLVWIVACERNERRGLTRGQTTCWTAA